MAELIAPTPWRKWPSVAETPGAHARQIKRAKTEPVKNFLTLHLHLILL
jgi:hypothetical protein